MRFVAIAITLLLGPRLFAQDIDKIINAAAVERTERVLSSDEMRGRATFTPDIERAADYIESRFKAAGLKTWNGSDSYRQPFTMVRAALISATGSLDGEPLPEDHIVTISASPDLSIDEKSGYAVYTMKAGSDFVPEILHYAHEKTNALVLVDTSFAKNFPRLARFTRQQFKSDRSVIFILTSASPTRYSIHVRQEVTESKLANVVGILPGTARKNEIVIFSGHYDHLGVGKPDAKGDSIYNGANDDASGTTAVMMLADYFAKKKNNERTLVFAAFTAEEIGEFGSQYFSGRTRCAEQRQY